LSGGLSHAGGNDFSVLYKKPEHDGHRVIAFAIPVIVASVRWPVTFVAGRCVSFEF
jgi:hypothetical protein